MQVIVHETVHAHGPKHEYYKQGVVIEEATTELTSRRIMREKWGHVPTPQMDKYKPQTVAEKFKVGSGGAYQGYINGLRSAVGDALKLDIDAAERVLDDAALAYKKLPSTRGYSGTYERDLSPTEQVNKLVQEMRLDGQELTLEQHEAVTDLIMERWHTWRPS